MRHIVLTDAISFHLPILENDQILMAISIGSRFQQTTFPSGWVSPDEPLINIAGLLMSRASLDALLCLTGHEAMAAEAAFRAAFGPNATLASLINAAYTTPIS